jgi:SAM-dependent methyltransferase
VTEPDDLIQEQIRYYDARAAEYDRMLEEHGRYEADSLDPTTSDPDTTELARVEEALKAFGAEGDVLEMACGTGWWTQRLALTARSVTAIDSSAQMLELSRKRVVAGNVSWLEANVFDWSPDRQYDVVFFAFFLSHVPPDLFDGLWTTIAASLKRDGRVFFLDEFAWDRADEYEQPTGDDRGTTIRHLEDGREYRMIKVYYAPKMVQQRLEGLGWRAMVSPVGRRIYFGEASPQKP